MFESFVWKAYGVTVGISRLIYVNILWVLFTILGLGIFGFFPATAAMFSIMRKWVLGDKDFPIFKTFWQTFKSSLFEMNVIGYVLLLLGLLLYVDLRFFQTATNIFAAGLSFLMIFLLLIYFVMILYVFPIYSHYNYKLFEYIKYSFIITLGKPLNSIMMIVGSFLVYFIYSKVPVIIIFCGGSLLALVLMWITMRVFPRNEVEV